MLLEFAGVLPGDFNLDGAINFRDFLTLSRNFSSEDVTYGGGDTNCDGTVRFSDYLILSANFGQTRTAAVPEGSSIRSLLSGLLLLVLARRARAS